MKAEIPSIVGHTLIDNSVPVKAIALKFIGIFPFRQTHLNIFSCCVRLSTDLGPIDTETQREVGLTQVDRIEQMHKYFVMQGKHPVFEILKMICFCYCEFGFFLL